MSDEKKVAILLAIINVLTFLLFLNDPWIGSAIIFLFPFTAGFIWYFQWFTVNYWKWAIKILKLDENEEKEEFA